MRRGRRGHCRCYHRAPYASPSDSSTCLFEVDYYYYYHYHLAAVDDVGVDDEDDDDEWKSSF